MSHNQYTTINNPLTPTEHLQTRESRSESSDSVPSSSSQYSPAELTSISLRNFLKSYSRLPVFIVRSLFQRLLLTVSRLQLAGKYVTDLNLDAVTLDSEYNLYIDAASLQENTTEGLHSKSNAQSLGKILFAMVASVFPTIELEGEEGRWVYSLESWAEFWSVCESNLVAPNSNNALFKPELREMIQALFIGDESLANLLNHQWMQGQIMDQKAIAGFLLQVQKKQKK